MKGCLVSEKLKIGVLLSGSGTNFQAILDEAEKGLPVEVVKVVASRPDAYGIERANAAGIPVLVMNREKYADPEAADAQIVAALQEAGAQYVVMACLLYTSPSPRDPKTSRMPSSA